MADMEELLRITTEKLKSMDADGLKEMSISADMIEIRKKRRAAAVDLLGIVVLEECYADPGCQRIYGKYNKCEGNAVAREEMEIFLREWVTNVDGTMSNEKKIILLTLTKLAQ